MKLSIKLLCAFVLTLTLSGFTKAQTITLQPDTAGIDVIMSSTSNTSNYGTFTTLEAKRWTSGGVPFTLRGLIKFAGLSTIPIGSIVSSAVLTLGGVDHSPLTQSNACYLQRITQNWVEGTVTWNTQPTVTTTGQISTAQSTSATQDFALAVTSMVQKMIDSSSTNYGWMLRLQSEANYYTKVTFASSDYTTTPSKRPKLVVTYAPGYFRSKQTGNWNSASTWETSSDNVNWYNATTTPKYTANTITIQSAHTVTITATDTLDQTVVNGTLVYSGGTLRVNNGTGIDLTVNGTIQDDCSNGISWATSATWSIGSSGTIIKTSASNCDLWRDAYDGGISTIPATATWNFRKTGATAPSISTASMTYPNITFENNYASATTWTIGYAGSAAHPAVKGNFNVGGSGTYNVVFENTNTNTAMLKIEGALTVKTTSAFRIYNNIGSEVQGNITANGTVEFSTYTGPLLLSGTNNQTIGGVSQSWKTLNIDKTSATNTVTLNIPLTITSSVSLSKGKIVSTSTNLLTFNNLTTVSGASDTSFVSGPVKKIGNEQFTFPVGKSTNYQPISISAPSNSTAAYTAEYFNAGQSLGSAKDSTIDSLSTCEYWVLNNVGTAYSAYVSIGWDALSCHTTSQPLMQLAEWNGTKWLDLGNSTVTYATVTSAVPVSTFGYFTLAQKHCYSPTANAGSDVTIASGDSVVLGSTTVSGVLYNWSPITGLNNTAISNPTLRLQDTTNAGQVLKYYVTATQGVCSRIDSVNVTITAPAGISCSNSFMAQMHDVYVPDEYYMTAFTNYFAFEATDTIAALTISKIDSTFSRFKSITLYEGDCASLTYQFDSVKTANDTLFFKRLLPNLVIGNKYLLLIKQDTACGGCSVPPPFNAYVSINKVYAWGCPSSSVNPCNLILNGTFEDYDYTTPSLISACKWISNGGTTCSYSSPLLAIKELGTMPSIGSSPNCGSQHASLELYTYIQAQNPCPNHSINTTISCVSCNTTQHYEQHLQQTLTAGVVYYAQMNVRYSGSRYASKGLGLHFSNGQMTSAMNYMCSNCLASNTSPATIHSNGTVLSSSNWQTLNGCFTAAGGEDYATIGLFYNGNAAASHTLVNSSISAMNSKYYIDDVKLVRLAEAGADAFACNSPTLGPICVDCTNDLSDASSGAIPGATYSWSPTTGLSCSTCPNPVATPSSTTTYTLTVNFTNPWTGSTCSATDQVIVTAGVCCASAPGALDWSNTNSAAIGSGTTTSQTIIINGTYTVFTGSNVTLSGCTVLMGPNARINVNNGATLTLTGTTLQAYCDQMWDGIYLNGLGQNGSQRLAMSSSCIIKDAKNAVVSNFGGRFSIANSTFRNNWYGLTVNTYSTVAHPGSVTSTTFETQSTGCIAPHLNQRAFIGVLVRSNAQFNVNTNTFTNLSVGIKDSCSNMDIKQNSFNSFALIKCLLPEDQCPTGGRAIWATASNDGVHHTLNIGTSTSTDANTFTDCYRGIWVERFNNLSDIGIQYNTFNKFDVGVRLKYLTADNITLSENNFNTGTTTGRIGIWAESISSGFPIAGTPGYSTYFYNINNNLNYITSTITNWASAGILYNRVTSNVYFASDPFNLNIIGNNNIYHAQNTNSNRKYFGIQIQNSSGVLTQHNYINYAYTQTSTPLNYYGISLESSTAPYSVDNTITSYDYAIRCFNQQKAYLQCNQMVSNQRGVLLEGTTNITTQGSSGAASDNKWISTVGSNSDIVLIGGGVTASNWYVQSSTGYVPIPQFGSSTIIGGATPSGICNYSGVNLMAQGDFDFSNQQSQRMGQNVITGYSVQRITTDSLTQNQFDSLMTTNSGKFTLVGMYISEEKFTEAAALNNSIAPGNIPEADLQTAYITHINVLSTPGYEVDSSTAEILYNIGNKSAYDGGDGIYIARAIMGMYVNDFAPEEDSSGTSSRMAAPESIKKALPKAEASFKLYPNPSNGRFTIMTNTNESYSINITNVLGKIVYKTSAMGNTTEIDLSRQSKGLYFVNIKTKDAMQVQKVIIE